MTAPPPLPRWFLLLPLLAALVWWPVDPFWKSDDWLALHYAQHLSRALADFTGPQYGATDVWWFYRPLITLSFWADQCLGGPSPFVSHLGNVLAHAANALLVALLWRRFLPDGRAFASGLLWACMPGHQASIVWAVGRVDSHTAVWCFATLLLVLRRVERRGPAWPMLVAFAGALCSKELAWIVPLVAVALVALRAEGALAARLRTAGRTTAPLWVLLALHFGWRWFVLGRIVGGYDAMQFDPGTMAAGLARTAADLLVPMRWSGGGTAAAWLAALPVLAALVLALRAPQRLVAVPLFVVACAPMATFLASADNVHNLRYWYLPTAALVGLLAAPGRVVTALVLTSWAWPLWQIRADVVRADRESRAIDAVLQQLADGGAAAPLFVAGLPRTNATGTSLQFHFGIDRVLQPPFRSRGTALFALRPIVDGPGVFRLEPDVAPPLGSAWRIADRALAPIAPPPPLPELTLDGDIGADGVVDLSRPRLTAAVDGSRPLVLRARGERPAWFRLTLFTATGYLCCLVPDHGPADAAFGTIDLAAFFLGRPLPSGEWAVRPTTYALGDAFVMRGLEVPTTIDLSPAFPVLLETGAITGDRFVATRRTRRPVTFAFDRDYPRWVRQTLGLER
ncbi:MAG: hypothetical protein JNL08_20550 [Planctomycetes bacterium]|nr:hypothetical protein [Planctomycetota bacterium]